MARKPRESPAERKARAKAKAEAEIAEGYRRGRLEMACETYGPPSPAQLVERELDAQHAYWLEQLRLDAERTGNPLFVWDAIALCRKHASHKAMILAATDEEAARAAMDVVPAPLPDWVLRYLGNVAHAISNLAKGRDWRTFLQIPDEGWSERERSATRAWLAGTLDPDEAAKLVPCTLGLTRPGYNAFREHIAINHAAWLADDVRHLREAEGMTLDEAAAEVAEREGYEDPRSVLRIVQRARKPKVAKPPR